MKNKVLFISRCSDLGAELTEKLHNQFDVELCHDIKTGCHSLMSNKDILAVVIEVELEDESGIRLLGEFKSEHPESDLSVIFLSNDDDDEIILDCFEAGAEHFISKKHSTEVIIQQINTLISYREKVQRLSIEEVKLSELVNTSMIQSSFYGACLDLVSELQFASNEQKMAQYIFDFLLRYGIYSSISFDAPNAHFNFNHQTYYCSPLEEKVFEVLKDKGRIYEFGTRAIFNSSCFSLLIKNMPAKDSVEYGLFIDIFAKLVPSIEMSFLNLLNKQKLKATQGQLKHTVETIKDATIKLQESRQELMDELIMQIGLSFHQYEFTDQQEEFLTELIETNILKQTENSAQFIDINDELSEMVVSLEQSQQGSELGYIDSEPNLDVELF